MNKYNFKYLKAHVGINEVLCAYGLNQNLRQKGDTLCGPCPIHGGDNPTAFRVHLTRNIWNCFTACGGGDTVDLIRHVKKCSYAKAARYLYQLLPDKKPSIRNEMPHKIVNAQQFVPFKRTIPLYPHVPFLQKTKNISIKTAIHFETGTSSNNRYLKNKVAVRLHDLIGKPLGYCGRQLKPKDISQYGKWQFPKNFPKKEILYNAHRAVQYRNRGIVVVECPWAVMRFYQVGVKNVVGLLGTSVSGRQFDWLVQAPVCLIIMDGDDAGRKAAIEIAQKMYLRTKPFIYILPENMEPEDLSENDIKTITSYFFSFF
jgi:DNA primase